MKKGDRGYFGRRRGEKTLGEIVKVNRKTVKVRQLESRGTLKDHPVGTVWTVPHALWTPEDAGRPAYSTPRPAPAPTPKRPDAEILADLRSVDCALSPENLTCDGELSRSAVRRRYSELKRRERALLAELGRKPTSSELYGDALGW